MLYLISLGIGDEKDISLRGLEAIKKSKRIYLESYTSKLNTSIKKLETLYKKKITLVPREFVEDGKIILKQSKKENVALLIIGNVFFATTHTDLFLRAKQEKIKVEIIHNTSVLDAIGVTGLSLYKFGKITSIPFDNKNIKTPYEVLKENKDLHTLFLLDLDPMNNRYMTVNDALNYLMSFQHFNPDTLCVACCALSSKDEIIKVGKAKELINKKFDKFPQCLIIPGKLHFMEEEVLSLYKK